jgi:hypothetical protein
MSPEPVRQYTDEIHDALGYWATWLPGNRLELGQCGPVSQRVFDPQSSLANFNIEFEVAPDSDPSDIQYQSKGAVQYTLQAAADTQQIQGIPQGTAGIKLNFNRENAVVLVAKQARQRRMADTNSLIGTLNENILTGEFPVNFAVVTDVVVADSGSIIISSSRDAEMSVTAKADFSAGLLDLASASLGLERKSSRDLQTEILAQTSLTPLFKLVGLKRNGRFGLGKKKVDRLRFEDSEDLEVGLIDPGDVDDEE